MRNWTVSLLTMPLLPEFVSKDPTKDPSSSGSGRTRWKLKGHRVADPDLQKLHNFL